MIAVIARKEIRDILSSPKFVVAFSVCAALILLSFYTGGSAYKMAEQRYQAAKAENLRQFEGLTDWLMVNSNRIFLPPQPLAALVNGVSNDVGRTIEVSGRGEMIADGSRYAEEPLFAVFRFLDLQFLFSIVLSLFAILLGHDAISGEKERGTLRLSFANAVPRSSYLIGKISGLAAALVVPLCITILIGCLLLPLRGINLSGDDWFRLFLIIVTGLLFFLAFLSMSVMVSTLTRRSSTSFLILLVTWIGCALIIPRVSVMVAGRAVAVPSVDEMSSQKTSLNMQLWSEDRDKMANYEAPKTSDMEAVMKDLNEFMEGLADERDKKLQELAGRLNEDRRNKQRVQENLAFGIARVSPMSSLTLATSSLAGTDLTLKRHFEELATGYQTEFGNFMQKKTGMKPGGKTMRFRKIEDGAAEEEEKKIDPQEIPEFGYRSDSWQEAINRALPDMGLLGLFALVFFVGSSAAFNRYDLR